MMAPTTPAPRPGKPVALILVALTFVLVPLWTWYLTWFGRPLTDSTLDEYIRDVSKPRHLQHGLEELARRIERGDPGAVRWYGDVIDLSQDARPEIRQVAAWLMGHDSRHAPFRDGLLKLLADKDILVRRNASLALLRFGDKSGLDEIRAMLKAHPVLAGLKGTVVRLEKDQAVVRRGMLLGRIDSAGQTRDVTAPLSGRFQRAAGEGIQLSPDQPIGWIQPDLEHVWEALRALYVIGEIADIDGIENFLESQRDLHPNIRRQAEQTIRRIRERTAGG